MTSKNLTVKKKRKQSKGRSKVSHWVGMFERWSGRGIGGGRTNRQNCKQNMKNKGENVIKDNTINTLNGKRC